jgi:hypothetical protein
MAAPRIYHVAAGDKVHLVWATHPSQAAQHVARGLIEVRVATQHDIVECVSKGIQPERIKGEQQEIPA